jgi:hypothetical protein
MKLLIALKTLKQLYIKFSKRKILSRHKNNKVSFKTYFVVFVSCLLIYGIYRDFSILFQYSEAVGVDGYYYVIQVNEFVDNGKFYFPTRTPAILFFFITLNFFIQNTIVSIKLGSVILHIASCICFIKGYYKKYLFWLYRC